MIVGKKKDKGLRIRMSPLELEFLDRFCETYKLSRSKILRLALKSYIYRHIDNKKRPNKKIIISQNEIRPLLDKADDALIRYIAEISFQNGVADHRYLDDILDSLKEDEVTTDYNLDLEGRVKSLIENVFNPDAQNWFESIRYGWNKKIMIIGGKHNLGNNFSLFIKYLMERYMNIYNYKLVSEELRESKPDQNNKSVNTIILSFGPLSSIKIKSVNVPNMSITDL